MDTEKIFNEIFSFGIKILYCIIILIICLITIKISKYLLNRFFSSRLSENKVFDERKSNTFNSLFNSVLKYGIYFLGFCGILSIFGIPPASLLAVAGIGTVALGFGAQSLVKDVLTGFFILMEDQYGVGDIVEIEGKSGTIEAMSVRTTSIRGFDGSLYIVPNGNISIVTNMCKGYILAIVDIYVDYKENIDNVISIIKDELEKSKPQLTGLISPPSVLGVVSIKENVITIRITAECQVKENYQIERNIKVIIKNRLDKEKIIIPLPQRKIQIIDSQNTLH